MRIWGAEDEAGSLDQFIMERMEMEGDEDLDVVAWWEEKAGRWPWVAHLARLYLSQPATSATSERLFSVAGSVVRQKRASLSGPNMELLTCLSWNLSHPPFEGKLKFQQFLFLIKLVIFCSVFWVVWYRVNEELDGGGRGCAMKRWMVVGEG